MAKGPCNIHLWMPLPAPGNLLVNMIEIVLLEFSSWNKYPSILQETTERVEHIVSVLIGVDIHQCPVHIE